MTLHASLEDLERIIGAATKIGSRWSENRSKLLIDEKSAGQFASNADVEIETFVRDQLAKCFPGQPVIGEELGGDLGTDATGWAIDPIDGTSNFVLGLPIWGISIGYIENGRSMLGAIALPDLQLTLSAGDQQGLRINNTDATKVRHISPVKILALGENDFETGPETDARAQVFREEGYSVVRYRCAVFSLAMSAIGRLSGYVENGCGLWDIAAAEVICREAGMRIQTSQVAAGRYAVDARWAGAAALNSPQMRR
ncbi:MAG: inositol monophosphatase family protein [Pseudomonadota bacterium]